METKVLTLTTKAATQISGNLSADAIMYKVDGVSYLGGRCLDMRAATVVIKEGQIEATIDLSWLGTDLKQVGIVVIPNRSDDVAVTALANAKRLSEFLVESRFAVKLQKE